MSQHNKDVLEIVRRARRQGFRVEQTGGDHWRFVPPDKTKGIYFSAGTPSDVRGLRNMIAELRQRGYVHRRIKHRRRASAE